MKFILGIAAVSITAMMAAASARSAPDKSGAEANAEPKSSTASGLQSAKPISIERLSLPGPVEGVVVKINLADPRVRVEVALVDDRDPDGDGPAVGRLDTTTSAARKFDFAVTMNASFFVAPIARKFAGKDYRYFVGNGAHPVGWHYSNGKLITKPSSAKLRATMIVHESGKISLRGDLAALPADTKYAVSGNAMLLVDGALPKGVARGRAPTSCVAISADGKTLWMIAIDGRQDKHSRGVTFEEMVKILIDLGATHAINLDGGGSTTLVLKDPATGVHVIANQPSDGSSLGIAQRVERPVVDVIGVSVRD